MADKPIIIDGVDVSKCDFLWKEKLPKKVCNNGNLNCECKNNPNCDYKRYKQADQKLGSIKERLTRVSYLDPQSTRLLKLEIENIIGDKTDE